MNKCSNELINVISYNLRIIHEYFQPKSSRKIVTFSLGRENNIISISEMSIARSGQGLIFFFLQLLFLFLWETLPLDNVGTRLHGYKVKVCSLGWEKPRWRPRTP